jgi:peptidoglycan-associated lipoprotein
MMIERTGFTYGIVMVGLVGLLALGGCAKKSGTATTSGTEAQEAGADASGQAGEPGALREERVEGSSTMGAKAEQREIDARKAQEAALQRLQNVYFALDRWELTDEGKQSLAEGAEFLKQNPSAKLIIEGHCDERGSREYNLVLGEKRAQEVRRYLLDLGVTNPVSLVSYGKERPVCTEPDESCYWQNRRAHVVVQSSR